MCGNEWEGSGEASLAEQWSAPHIRIQQCGECAEFPCVHRECEVERSVHAHRVDSGALETTRLAAATGKRTHAARPVPRRGRSAASMLPAFTVIERSRDDHMAELMRTVVILLVDAQQRKAGDSRAQDLAAFKQGTAQQSRSSSAGSIPVAQLPTECTFVVSLAGTRVAVHCSRGCVPLSGSPSASSVHTHAAVSLSQSPDMPPKKAAPAAAAAAAAAAPRSPAPQPKRLSNASTAPSTPAAAAAASSPSVPSFVFRSSLAPGDVNSDNALFFMLRAIYQYLQQFGFQSVAEGQTSE